jgi:hypothetical protein
MVMGQTCQQAQNRIANIFTWGHSDPSSGRIFDHDSHQLFHSKGKYKPETISQEWQSLPIRTSERNPGISAPLLDVPEAF